jgi:hypothetical protein
MVMNWQGAEQTAPGTVSTTVVLGITVQPLSVCLLQRVAARH